MAMTQILADQGESSSGAAELRIDAGHWAAEVQKNRTALAALSVLAGAEASDQEMVAGWKWMVDGPLKLRAKELHSKLSSIGFDDLDGIRVMMVPNGGYTILFEGLMGPLRILADGSFINSTGKGFHEVPELFKKVFAAIEKLRAEGIAAESRELAPERLETSNFRVDSTNWKVETLADGTRVKRNPEGDVTELLEGEFAGEQHFTQEAALRETAKAGKRMPTKEEWGGIIRAINPRIDPEGGWQDSPDIAAKLGLPLAGYRNPSSASYINQGTNGSYWASSPTGVFGYHVVLQASQVLPANFISRAFGLSVRCLTD